MTEEQIKQVKERSGSSVDRTLGEMKEAGVEKEILMGLKSRQAHGVEVSKSC